MAYIQNIHMFLFLLALTACLEIQFSEARQIKAIKKQELSPVKTETGLQHYSKQAIKVEQGVGSQKDNLQVTGQRKFSPPMIPPPSHESISSDDVYHSDSFQPTTPGNSPGIGHSFAGKKHNTQAKAQDFTSATGQTDGFQPTTPGHSPGVGHSFGNFKAGPNA
ncbi:UNVERIFIED_CONTAM: hypothetical protein Sangu_1253200 [Sesamum angustifolium]|uniref:Precursor of CEP9 n=1 Tax=Sesamum angustifolium TaxID=2727405 RepID=A0AAW2NL32_9LAMI